MGDSRLQPPQRGPVLHPRGLDDHRCGLGSADSFGIPPQTHWYPDDIRFVAVVMVVGAVVVGLAMLGFKKLAAFSSVCSPWMFLMFVAGAVVALARARAGRAACRASDFFGDGRACRWTGTHGQRQPAPMGFWTSRPSPGSAISRCTGAVGHGAVPLRPAGQFLRVSSRRSGCSRPLSRVDLCGADGRRRWRSCCETPLTELDSGCRGVHHASAGPASSPSSSRAGRRPTRRCIGRVSRCRRSRPAGRRGHGHAGGRRRHDGHRVFPVRVHHAARLRGTVRDACWPCGAIVLAEHWLFPRIGLTRYWAHYQGKALNWPALAAWGGSIAVGLALERAGACICSTCSSRCTCSPS